MYDLERFGELLRRDLVPLVYAQGFEAHGSVFRRARGERIDLVSLLGARRGRQCRVELGVHYSFLPAAGRPSVTADETSRLRQHDCLFRECLRGPEGRELWWSYGTDDATAEANAAGLVQAYRDLAPLFFARFEPFPEVFHELTPADLDNGGHPLLPACLTRAQAALTMARVMRHLGHNDRCREFAEAGLRSDGAGARVRSQLADLMVPA